MQNYVFYEAFLPITRLLMHAIWTRRRFTSIERMNECTERNLGI